MHCLMTGIGTAPPSSSEAWRNAKHLQARGCFAPLTSGDSSELPRGSTCPLTASAKLRLPESCERCDFWFHGRNRELRFSHSWGSLSLAAGSCCLWEAQMSLQGRGEQSFPWFQRLRVCAPWWPHEQWWSSHMWSGVARNVAKGHTPVFAEY